MMLLRDESDDAALANVAAALDRAYAKVPGRLQDVLVMGAGLHDNAFGTTVITIHRSLRAIPPLDCSSTYHAGLNQPSRFKRRRSGEGALDSVGSRQPRRRLRGVAVPIQWALSTDACKG
jgi:hypothetical protein